MQIKLHKFFKINIILLLPALFALSCGVWENFTTYFNLYYNTSNIFDDAEQSIKEQNLDIFNTENLIVSGSAKQQLEKVVEKASALLQFHSESDYLDDALLMLGKSFYYQKNYQKALRKFQEMIATQPNSDKILEAQLWIGKTELRLKNFNDGLAKLDEVRKKAIEEDEEEIASQAFIEDVSYQISQENYPAAINLSKEFLEVSSNDEINAEVAFQVGKLYSNLNDQENAIKSFGKVFDYSPSFETELASYLELGKAYRSDGQNKKALEIFKDLKSEDKYLESYDKIDLEIALTEIETGNLDDAINSLILVDTTYRSSQSSGIAKYKLGEIFENTYKNYDSAFYFYNRAATSPAPAEYILAANDKVKLFNKYKKLNAELNGFYKQLNYIRNPDAFVKDSIDFYADTTSEITVDGPQEELLRESRGRGSERELNTQTFARNAANRGNPDQNKIPPVRPVISEDSVKSLIVKNSFEMGNLFFTEFNLPDSAYHYYKIVLDDFPNSDYQARTMYALGSYYQTINKYLEADSLFNLIYDNYKNESIVNAAANKLDKPLIDLRYDPAKQLYIEAEDQLKKENFSESVNRFLNIYKNYPQSSLAVKALYASGWILENKLENYDSAAVIYDSVYIKYPQSIYASTLGPKINFYNQEKERIKKAYEDSLKLIQQKMLDSLAADSIKASAIDSSGINLKSSLNVPDSLISDSLKNVPPRDSLLINDTKNNVLKDTIPENRREIAIPKEEKNNNQTDSLNKPKIDLLR